MQDTITTQIAPAQKPDAVSKLERVRAGLRMVIRDVQITEGRLLDFETADGIMRTLHSAARDLEELTLKVAVLERRANPA